MRVRITQLDGSLPNLALMRISAFHKQHGDDVHFTYSPHPDPDEPNYQRVYASCIFKFNTERVRVLRAFWPDGDSVTPAPVVLIAWKPEEMV